MRINIYAEEMTDRVEVVETTAEGRTLAGIRFYLLQPSTLQPAEDSASVTFWGKHALRVAFGKAVGLLNGLEFEPEKTWVGESSYNGSKAHLVDIIDEAFGRQPVMTSKQLLSFLEVSIAKLQHERDTLLSGRRPDNSDLNTRTAALVMPPSQPPPYEATEPEELGPVGATGPTDATLSTEPDHYVLVTDLAAEAAHVLAGSSSSGHVYTEQQRVAAALLLASWTKKIHREMPYDDRHAALELFRSVSTLGDSTLGGG